MESNENVEQPDLTRFLSKQSSRHHYIPQFLIEGFTNHQGRLYVFDKEENKILNKQRAPKQLFYEWDRNTVEIKPGANSSIIEDLLYSKVDALGSKIIREFQATDLKSLEMTTEKAAHMLFFLLTLYWRIPLTDYAASDLMKRSKISAVGIDPETLRNDPTYQKLRRAGIFNHAIKEMVSHGARGSNFCKIQEFAQDGCILGDNPLLFRRHSNLFREFGEIDLLFAVSSKRIYSSTNEELKRFKFMNLYRYNVAVINQSKRYVASGNRQLLEESVKAYLEFKKKGVVYFMAERAFEPFDV